MTDRIFVAFIPARGGSKSIPRKNMSILNGRPLIDFTISAAKSAGVFQEIIVSTDDNEIAEYALSAGCQIHQRPSHLATDSSRVVDSIVHAATTMSIDLNAVIVVLQPTSPLRAAESIKAAVQLHRENEGASVVGVVECEHHPYKTVHLENGRIHAGSHRVYLEAARQDLPQVFRINGAIYLSLLLTILHEQTLIPMDSLALLMSRVESIDVDNSLDLILSEVIEKHSN
jgi:CMP-N-acetylneuraminic acid synthetase